METNIAFEEWAEIFWVHELATILGNGEMTKFPGKKTYLVFGPAVSWVGVQLSACPGVADDWFGFSSRSRRQHYLHLFPSHVSFGIVVHVLLLLIFASLRTATPV